ncbi:FRG domain-containing protein [Vibrio chagasii]|nr:FRG domain-containing protein [Vibrio chagasii]CAH7141972.1 FRG domain-containing protein [Vibrio chagasii]
MIVSLDIKDKFLTCPELYNVYPIRNEVSLFGNLDQDIAFNNLESPVLDDHYGRVFSESVYKLGIPYGDSLRMPFYPCGFSGQIVGEMRVPYRKVPVFRVEDISGLNKLFADVKNYSPQHEILVRGQTSTHNLVRSDEEKQLLFGSIDHVEPSFLASGSRKGYSELFLNSLWESQTRILLHDISVDMKNELAGEAFVRFSEATAQLQSGPRFIPFGLGLAQHYGMPSVGLDLTDNLQVALWFASNSIDIDASGTAICKQVHSLDSSRLFFFRCPKNSVYSHKAVKPDYFPECRPDNQNAWFGHVGWGQAKNQMASYLCCVVEVTSELIKSIPHNFENRLFPVCENDPILNYFWKIKGAPRYEGEAKRAISSIYRIERN